MENSYERLREVVEKVHDLLMLHGDGKSHCILSWDEFNDAVKMCRSALSIPPRQCDVGTTEEQKNRFVSMCNRHITCCKKCPLWNEDLNDFYCEINWSQSEYSTEPAKGNGEGNVPI